MSKPKNKSVTSVVDGLLYIADKEGVRVDPLKLQKLLYFAQALSLVRRGHPLFRDKIEAWQHGPVVPTVYKEYKKFKNKRLYAGEGFDMKIFTNSEQKILEDIIATFGKYTGSQLRNMTHKHLPWKNAFKKAKNTEITKQVIKQYYKGAIA